MGYNKNNLELKEYKKKEFAQNFKFLADIIGKCILYKDSAHDSVSELQLQIMTAITMEAKINYGVVMFGWITKWFKDAAKRKEGKKPLLKMSYGTMKHFVEEKDETTYWGERWSAPKYKQENNEEVV